MNGRSRCHLLRRIHRSLSRRKRGNGRFSAIANRVPVINRCAIGPRLSPLLVPSERTPEARALSATGMTRHPIYYGPLRLPHLTPRPPAQIGPPFFPVGFPFAMFKKPLMFCCLFHIHCPASLYSTLQHELIFTKMENERRPNYTNPNIA